MSREQHLTSMETAWQNSIQKFHSLRQATESHRQRRRFRQLEREGATVGGRRRVRTSALAIVEQASIMVDHHFESGDQRLPASLVVLEYSKDIQEGLTAWRSDREERQNIYGGYAWW